MECPGHDMKTLMKFGLRVHPYVLLLVALSIACQAKLPAEQNLQQSVVIMTYNVRYDNPGDGVDAWPHRRDRVAGLIRFHGADVAGLQEAQRNQIEDLVERLPEYGWYGVGRDDGASAGEFVPIFYRTDRFAAQDTGTFWLSPAPDGPGPPAWDAAITRIVSWAQLAERDTGRSFFVFNAHFDHVGEVARKESARLVLDRIGSMTANHPVVLLGDLNAEPDSDVYAILASGEGVGQRLVDSAVATSGAYGPEATFFGFEVSERPGRRIDYIFFSESVVALRYGVLSDQFGGRYPSDHLPVLAEIVIP
ncbi:MAG: endonuclease/exonuclease/phosphatase family protein [Rhodothermales bacterium]|nr:endonuclease/exonuclease/phosphatase family protein [Rhodothermales bacterium]